MNQIPVYGMGGFKLQYTDAAEESLKELDNGLCDRLLDHLLALAESNPYAGDTVPLGDKDRRQAEFENVAVTFWLMAPMKIMTVVTVVAAEEESDED